MAKMETIQVPGLGKAHLARGLVRTPRTMRRKDPIAFGGFGMRPDLPSVEQLPAQILKKYIPPMSGC